MRCLAAAREICCKHQGSICLDPTIAIPTLRVLLLYAHPNPDSFVAALHRATIETLAADGHEVDDCDLYAENFDPVLSRAERLGYHAVPANRAPVEEHVRRLERAEALVLVYPVWNFGFPAILKGYFDRVFLPGVSFRLENGLTVPNLKNIRHLVAVTTYGAPRHRAMLLGDAPRRIVKRVLRVLVAPLAKVRYLALHRMNTVTQAEREAFILKVRAALKGLS
jgi:NAD(P)H dehydrogenase (quinone)